MESNSKPSSFVTAVNVLTTTLYNMKENVKNTEAMKSFNDKIEKNKRAFFNGGIVGVTGFAKGAWCKMVEVLETVSEKLLNIQLVKSSLTYVKSKYEEFSTENLGWSESFWREWQTLHDVCRKRAKEVMKKSVEYLRSVELVSEDGESSESSEDEDNYEDTDSDVCRANLSEMSHLDLLGDLTDYDSYDDPDFLLDSETESSSVDSLEYRSTENEDSEEPFTEEKSVIEYRCIDENNFEVVKSQPSAETQASKVVHKPHSHPSK